MYRLFLIPLYLTVELGLVSSSATITVPVAGNCGDDTVLTCHFTGSIGFTTWVGLNRNLVTNGTAVRPEDNNKYTQTVGTTSFTLTIHNTDITDTGDYRCQNKFDQSLFVSLKIQCKASSASWTVSVRKKVVITADKLYPASPTLAASIKKENSLTTSAGSTMCLSSAQYKGYYRCAWTSDNSLADGSYTYSLVVTTITKADPLKGSFRIVSPQPPAISNIVKLGDAREAIDGYEGQQTTIECTSKGGYPVPNVVWYIDSMSDSTELNSSGAGTLKDDGTYTVTLQYTFKPTVSQDRKKLICKSYYPEADTGQRDPKSKSVILYLTLKPTQPIAAQKSVVSTGDTVEVTCRTMGCRPAANISWSYQGPATSGKVKATLDPGTETYTVTSLYSKQVSAADNGHTVQCVVTHPALVSPSEITASVNLTVQFSVGPASTRITGNKEIIATGQKALSLTCTTGSSNPASDITWKNGSEALTSNRSYTESAGDNNGLVRSQQLMLYPTRYMDGDRILCSVSNTVSQSHVVATITLKLKYSPLVTIQGHQPNTLTEGESKQLSCKVNSKPSANITWYHGSSVIVQGTPVSNVLNYSLTPMNRTHYGNYSCKASNGIGSEYQEQISITVRFKPLTTTITGNSNVIANGQNTLPLVCTSGSSNPVSDVTWRINSDITPSSGSLSDQNGEYGGMKCRRRLTLTPTRDNDGDSISCEAYNSIGRSEIKTVTLDLRFRPLIKTMKEIIAVEGNTTVLMCVAASKPASTFKWYKEGQSGILRQGTGTLDSNKLTYTISNVTRKNAATYSCNADNGIETADNKSVVLTVYYPPEVMPVTTNTSVKNKTAVITCNAEGVPDTNYRYGQWEQRWLGYDDPVFKKAGSEKLVLTNLTYEHSGVYTCSASNGIKVFGMDKEFMEGSVHLLVKSFPIITSISEKTSTRLKENATVEVYFYSNIEGSAVKIYRTVNSSRQEEIIYSVSEADVELILPVFGRNIKTSGTIAQIMIQINSREGIGLYAVNISNEVGYSTKSFEIVPKGPPSDPYNVTVDVIQYNKARLSWIRGYHGGFAQTFVIQMSTDLKNWKIITVFGGKNESEEPISRNLLDLHDSTTYYIQMYAFNSEGNSSSVGNLNFTTPSKLDTPGISAAVVGGAAGGGSALFLIVLIVVVVFILKRRGVFTKGKGNSHDDETDRKPVYSDENDYGMQDNPMYVSAGPREQTPAGSGSSDAGAVYSTVDKKKLVADSRNNDVYAEVDKSKKTDAKQVTGKKEKTEKTKHGFIKDKKGKKVMQEGDLYENTTTTEMKDRLAKQNKNDETIYENPEPSKPAEIKNVNKDGLIYADLTFNDPPKGQKKLVIHGLDSMTEYVQVDFTKKADPLPDSDDENNSPKK